MNKKVVKAMGAFAIAMIIITGSFMMPVTGGTVQAAEPTIKVEPADAQISFNLPHVGASIDKIYRLNCEEVVSSAHFGDGILNVEAYIYGYDEVTGDISSPEEDTLIADKKYVLIFCPYTKDADGYYFFERSEVDDVMDESTTRSYFTSIPSGASFLQAVKDARNDFLAFFIFEPLKGDPTPDPTPTPSPKSEPAKPAEPAKTDLEIREALEETLPVSPVTIDTTQYYSAEASVVPGTSYNLSNFITTKGIVKGINTAVTASNKNNTSVVEIYSGKPFCFNSEILKAVNNGKKTVVYYFQYEGHIYSVTVPATVDATKVLERAGFAGPLYVGQQLGTTRLIK